MKKMAVLLGAVLFLQVAMSEKAVAGNGYHYLGPAMSMEHCRRLVMAHAAVGYTSFLFGPSYDDRGVYYPFYNACFGGGIGGGQSARFFDVYPRQGEDLGTCAKDIEWGVPGIECRIESHGTFLQCRSRDGVNKQQIEAVRCVDRVYPTQAR